jgi:hypothetical protein
VTTADVAEITQTSAVSGGDVTNNGGAEVIARGVCWSYTGIVPIQTQQISKVLVPFRVVSVTFMEFSKKFKIEIYGGVLPKKLQITHGIMKWIMKTTK